jgi:hypothetical protein
MNNSSIETLIAKALETAIATKYPTAVYRRYSKLTYRNDYVLDTALPGGGLP